MAVNSLVGAMVSSSDIGGDDDGLESFSSEISAILRIATCRRSIVCSFVKSTKAEMSFAPKDWTSPQLSSCELKIWYLESCPKIRYGVTRSVAGRDMPQKVKRGPDD